VKAEPVDRKLRRYKSNLLRHVTRMDNSRMANGMLIVEQMDKRGLERL
jgi:hypothetical protein